MGKLHLDLSEEMEKIGRAVFLGVTVLVVSSALAVGAVVAIIAWAVHRGLL